MSDLVHATNVVNRIVGHDTQADRMNALWRVSCEYGCTNVAVMWRIAGSSHGLCGPMESITVDRERNQVVIGEETTVSVFDINRLLFSVPNTSNEHDVEVLWDRSTDGGEPELRLQPTMFEQSPAAIPSHG